MNKKKDNPSENFKDLFEEECKKEDVEKGMAEVLGTISGKINDCMIINRVKYNSVVSNAPDVLNDHLSDVCSRINKKNKLEKRKRYGLNKEQQHVFDEAMDLLRKGNFEEANRRFEAMEESGFEEGRFGKALLRLLYAPEVNNFFDNIDYLLETALVARSDSLFKILLEIMEYFRKIDFLHDTIPLEAKVDKSTLITHMNDYFNHRNRGKKQNKTKEIEDKKLGISLVLQSLRKYFS